MLRSRTPHLGTRRQGIRRGGAGKRALARCRWGLAALAAVVSVAAANGATLPAAAAPMTSRASSYDLYIVNDQFPIGGSCTSVEETLTSATFPPLPPSERTIRPDGCIVSNVGPVGVAFNPGGSTAYVVDLGKAQVVPVNAATFTAGKPFSTGGSSPVFAAVTPNDKYIVVPNAGSNNVAVISTTTHARHLVPVGHSPLAVAVLPDSSAAYVTNTGDGTVSVISLTGTPKVVRTITFPSPGCSGGSGIAVTPNGLNLYDMCNSNSELWKLSRTKAVKAISLAAGGQIVITPNGTTAYVAAGNNCAGGVYPVTLSTGKVGTAIPITCSYGLAVSPDGKYVAAGENTVGNSNIDLISTATNTVTSTFHSGGDAPGWLAFR